MSSLPIPPVPQRLREMLDEYPGHIERLQEVLSHVIRTSSAGVDPFDRAIWALEGRLEAFVSEAKNERLAAESDGDPQMIAKAVEKEKTMSMARPKRQWISDEALWAYFQQSKDDLK